MKLSGKDLALLRSNRHHRGPLFTSCQTIGNRYWIVWHSERGNLTPSCVRYWRSCAEFSRETSHEVRHPTKLQLKVRRHTHIISRTTPHQSSAWAAQWAILRNSNGQRIRPRGDGLSVLARLSPQFWLLQECRLERHPSALSRHRSRRRWRGCHLSHDLGRRIYSCRTQGTW